MFLIHEGLKPVIVAIIEKNPAKAEVPNVSFQQPLVWRNPNFVLECKDVATNQGIRKNVLYVTMPCWSYDDRTFIGTKDPLTLAEVKERFTDQYYSELRKIEGFDAVDQDVTKFDWLVKELKNAVDRMPQDEDIKRIALTAVCRFDSAWFLSFDDKGKLKVLMPDPIEGGLTLRTISDAADQFKLDTYEKIFNWKNGVVKSGKRTVFLAAKEKLEEAVQFMPDNDQASAKLAIGNFKLTTKWSEKTLW